MLEHHQAGQGKQKASEIAYCNELQLRPRRRLVEAAAEHGPAEVGSQVGGRHVVCGWRSEPDLLRGFRRQQLCFAAAAGLFRRSFELQTLEAGLLFFQVETWFCIAALRTLSGLKRSLQRWMALVGTLALNCPNFRTMKIF